jgi:hypothetical protein
MALEVRPAHDPIKEYGFLGVVVDTTNLEGSIWTWRREDGKFHIEKTAHPNGKSFGGGPQMVEISRDGQRVYWTNSLYSTWHDPFYPDGVPGAMVKADVGANGGLTLDEKFWVEFPEGYPSVSVPYGAKVVRRRSSTAPPRCEASSA